MEKILTAVVSIIITACVVNACNEENDVPSSEVREQRAVITAVVKEDRWGPDYTTTLVLDNGHIDFCRCVLGEVGDTLAVKGVYSDGDFVYVKKDVRNLSKSF